MIAGSIAAKSADQIRTVELSCRYRFWMIFAKINDVRKWRTRVELNANLVLRKDRSAKTGESPGPSRSRSRTLLPRSSHSRFALRRPLLYRGQDDRCVLSSRLSRTGSETDQLQFLAECRCGTGGGLSTVPALSPRDGAGNTRLVRDRGQRFSRAAPHRKRRARSGWLGRRSCRAIGDRIATFATTLRTTSRGDAARGGEDAPDALCGSADQ